MWADAGFVGFLAWISAGIGDRLLRVLKQKPVRCEHALAQSIPLGLGILSLATFGLGSAGRLDRTHLVLLLGVASLFAVGPGSILFRDSIRLSTTRAARTLRRGPTLDRLILGLTLLGLIGCGLAASIPVTDGDALCYHLQVPKVFLARKAVFFEPDLHETVYPLITELLNAIALEFRGPITCRWLQFLLGMVFALNVSMLARPVLNGRAWWAGAIALLVPTISNGMAAPLNDVALAAFGTAAIAAVMRSIDRPTFRSAALAGGFIGLALGVKYPALVLFGLLIVVMVWNRPSRLRRSFAMAAVFAAAALAVGGCWYVRAFANTGNPVFPYFRQYFGGAGLDEVLDPSRRSMPVTLWNVVTALVPMTLSPDRFESFAHQFGPVFLLFLPAIAFERPPRRVWVLLAIGYSFLTICVTQRQSMRFMLIALGPLAVGVAYLVRSWSLRRSIPSRLILGILAAALAMESAQAMARCRNGLKVIIGAETADQFLTKREPSYRVGRWIDRNLPIDARLIGQDHRGFYIPRDYTMELAHRRRTGLCRGGESPPEIIEHLKQSGFTHVMFCPPIPESAVEFDPTLGRILKPWLSARTPVYREDLADADGVIRRYAIYPLDSSDDLAASRPSEVTR